MAKKVVEECDVYLSLPRTKAYIVNNFTIPAGRDMSTEVDLVGVRRKPLQHRLEMDYEGMLLLIQSRVLPRV
jgi:hypothetical protein